MPTLTRPISGWGRYPLQICELERPERYADLRSQCTDASSATLIARGQGRSYGDASLNENGRVILTERLDRMLELDTRQGILKAEAGVTLADILPMIVKQGWFLPVTPGTKFVSLGGCVAADVHGKNHHHEGAFSEHVLSLVLIVADGSHLNCSATENADIFWATVGGMGLTGIIAEVTIKLLPIMTSQMMVQHHAAKNLKQLFQMLQDPTLDDQYSVAWIDCLASGNELGRGIAMFAHHAGTSDVPSTTPLASKHKRSRSLPFNLPAWLLNPLSISLFNKLYYWKEARKKRPFLSDYDSYFYPLDALANWNRMYGKRGFVQYQCVLPEANALEGLTALLKELSASRRSSFLAVLKRFGAQGKGLLSFPMPGYTLALDLPIRNKGLFGLLDKLDNIVLQHGGRVYLAKDARVSDESFKIMYPRYEEWLKIKNKIDPAQRFSSSLSRRLNITGSAK
jgi:decaprenylphospho-beta-D-ribofuranose 2-oxidase